jgi:hypothetical protein
MWVLILIVALLLSFTAGLFATVGGSFIQEGKKNSAVHTLVLALTLQASAIILAFTAGVM